MIQSNSEFLPNLSSQTANLRALTQKHKKFIWTAIHQTEFENIKQFHEDILNWYFVPHETTYLFVDAHCTGLGAVLAQRPSIEDCLPVAIASWATSKIEQCYPQLDLEGIAVDFVLCQFHQYLIGGPQVNVITDHKLLVSIFQNKQLGSLCLDCIKLHHQDINFKLTWKKGATNPADYASRHATPLSYLLKHIQQESEEYSKLCWFLHRSPYMQYLSIDALPEHANKDKILQDLSVHILHHWKSEATSNYAAYLKVLDELSQMED